MAYKSKEKQAEAAAKHYEKNKEVIKKRAKEHKKKILQELKKEIREIKESSNCTDCGKKYPYYVMQFDHIKGIKLFDIGNSNHWWSRKRLTEETEKCEIVCANCHAIRTYNRNRVSSMVE